MKRSDQLAAAFRDAVGREGEGVDPSSVRITRFLPDTVALEGQVGTLAQKERVGQIAQRLSGLHVDNGLTVAGNRLSTDSDLQGLAEAELRAEGLPSTLGVEVRKGVAHLVGSAGTMAERERACDAVARVAGIKDIRLDHLALATDQVIAEFAPRPEAQVASESIAADLDEVTMANAIERRLLDVFGPGLAEYVRTQVRHRTAFLYGFLRTARQRKQAAEVAIAAPGVRHVVNLIVAQDGSAGGDEALAHAIRKRLGRKADHASPVDVKAFVSGDAAYLFGSVDFPEQIEQAMAAAHAVPGIAHVFSDIQVSDRHFRPAKGAGQAAEDAADQLGREP